MLDAGLQQQEEVDSLKASDRDIAGGDLGPHDLLEMGFTCANIFPSIGGLPSIKTITKCHKPLRLLSVRSSCSN